MTQLVKCLWPKSEDVSLNPSIPLKVVHTYNLSVIVSREADPKSSLTRKSNSIGNLRVSERPHLKI